jgi:hypothetical protein
LLLTTFSRASASENVPEAERPNGRVAEGASENVPEAERPNGRVAEGRAARTRGGALTTLLGAGLFYAFSTFAEAKDCEGEILFRNIYSNTSE